MRYSSSFSFEMERDTLSKHTHSPIRWEKKHEEVCIDFVSGVCFAHEGQFNESTSRAPEGKSWTRDKRCFLFLHECQRPQVTGTDVSPKHDRCYSIFPLRGKVFRELGHAPSPTIKQSSHYNSRKTIIMHWQKRLISTYCKAKTPQRIGVEITQPIRDLPRELKWFTYTSGASSLGIMPAKSLQTVTANCRFDFIVILFLMNAVALRAHSRQYCSINHGVTFNFVDYIVFSG